MTATEAPAREQPGMAGRDRTPARAPEQDRQPAWLTVTIREIMVKLTDRAFILGTLSTLVLVAVGLAIGAFTSSRTQVMTVAVVDQAVAPMVDAVGQVANADRENYQTEVVTADNRDAALQLLRDGEADVLVEQTGGRWALTYDSSPEREFEIYFSQVLSAQIMADLAADAGITTAELERRATFDTNTLSVSQDRTEMAYVAGFGFALLFMMSSMVYGMQIATSVIEEKQSRIVEILVSVIPVRQLLAGKVLGNTVMAFAQMVLVVGVALIGVSFTDLSQYLPNFGSAIGWFLLFFLAGFLALACIWAAAGALGTRMEDLNQTSQPLIWILMMVYVAGFASSGTVREVLSFVPIASSVLMPVRLVVGNVSWWQPVVALLINLAFAAGTVMVGEKIYRNALLRTQGRLSYRQAFSLKD